MAGLNDKAFIKKQLVGNVLAQPLILIAVWLEIS